MQIESALMTSQTAGEIKGWAGDIVGEAAVAAMVRLQSQS